MEPFRIHILGCGSALPTAKHNPTSQIVELREKLFMIDCGEGTQMQLRRSHVGFNRIGAVFISHLHGDHCFGLIGMVSTFGMLGRTAPLHIYATPEFGPMLQSQLDMFCNGLDYDVLFHPIDTTRQAVIYDDRSLTVETIPLEHRVPCCGFLFREKPLLPHIRRDMIDFYRIPLSQINNIKAGADYTLADGTMVPNSRLTTPPDAPRSYAFCSDTRYMPRLHRLLRGVNVLYHESTYDTSHADRAQLYHHSTAAQAATVARDAEVGTLLLGHYSARYECEEVLLNEARAIFPNTFLTEENRVFSVE